MTKLAISGPSRITLTTLLDALPDPALLIELNKGTIQTANTQAVAFLGRNDLTDAPADELRAPPDRNAFIQALEQLRSNPAPTITLQESLLSADGPSALVHSDLRSFELEGVRFVLQLSRPRQDKLLGHATTLHDAVAQLPLPVLIAQAAHPRTVHVNAACAELCGLSSAGMHSLETAHRTWRVLRPDGQELEEHEVPTRRALEHGEAFGPEDLLLLPGNDSPPRMVSVISAPVRSPDEEVIAAVTTMMDVGNVREIERELRDAREVAENDARRKGAFYASLSRELRNPLTSILGYLDLIADPENGERERAMWYAQIRKSGESLMGLVQDLVDLGQMEAGTFTIEKAGFSTSLALAHVLSQARARAQQHDRDVVSRYTTPVPHTLTSDAGRFRQCLSTLIHFVIENTSRGDVTLQTAVIGVGEQRVLAFDVSSHCRDLTQQDLETLFDPFQPSTPRIRPWSLAFPVARRIAELMGGSVACGLETERLWFRMTVAPTPRDMEHMAHLSLPEEQEPPPSLASPTRLRGSVLLVEDNESDRLLVTKMLERSGLRVDFVECGADALARPVHRYDAILMDVELPDMDGLETTRRLRAEGATVPIVALTASVLAGDRERCLDAGCTAYLPKPIDRPMLLRTLDGLISTTEDRRVMSVLPAELASVEPLASTREDDPTLVGILPQFVTRMSRYVQHIARAIPDGEIAAATKAARSLGATAENCGFQPLADAANALADACGQPEKTDRVKVGMHKLEEVAKRVRAAYPDYRD